MNVTPRDSKLQSIAAMIFCFYIILKFNQRRKLIYYLFIFYHYLLEKMFFNALDSKRILCSYST